MQTVLLSCVFGAICTMVLWVVSSVAAQREQMMRRGDHACPRPRSSNRRAASMRIVLLTVLSFIFLTAPETGS